MDENEKAPQEDESPKSEELIEQEKQEERELKKHQAKERLISRLMSGNMEQLLTRVAFVLNHHSETRNSDLALQFKYWEIFQNKIYKGGKVAPEDMYRLERLTSITRARAKIQNEFELFIADEKIRNYRKKKEEDEKEEQVSNKPQESILGIYCDESGKTSNYLIVGSVWTLDIKREEELRQYFNGWKKDRGLTFKDEFHFTEMKKGQLPLYKEFFNEVIKKSDMLGFKAVVVDKTKIQKRALEDILLDLHYQLVHQGVEHEEQTGRVVLPRKVNFLKDKEEGNDNLFLTKLQQHLITQFKVYFEERLKLSIFTPVESYSNIFIQIADLFTGAVSRVLNQPKTGPGNHKDEFAEYVLGILGLNPTERKSQSDIGMIHFFE